MDHYILILIITLFINLLNQCNAPHPSKTSQHCPSQEPLKKPTIIFLIKFKQQNKQPAKNSQAVAPPPFLQQSGSTSNRDVHKDSQEDSYSTWRTLISPLRMSSLRLGTQVTSKGNPLAASPTRAQRYVKKTAADLKAIDEIRQLNKKKIDEE